MYRFRYKRLLDIVIATLALIVFTPALLAAAILVRVSLGSPVFFRQERLGRGGGVFTVQKFRTMVDRERTESGEIYRGHPDVPPLGSMMRRLKLDELPQIWNILRGDMSIVGPRPVLPKQLAVYDETTRQRLDVRPGLTGLAQVSGNTRLSWEERWKLDVEYVHTISFRRDIEIILKTVLVVILGEERLLRNRASLERKR